MGLNEVMEMEGERGIEMPTLWGDYWITNYEREGGKKDGNRQLEDLYTFYLLLLFLIAFLFDKNNSFDNCWLLE